MRKKYSTPLAAGRLRAGRGRYSILQKTGPPGLPEPKDRIGNLALGGEWVNTKAAMQGLLAKLRANPDDQKSRLLLAQAYMQEGRVTGNHPYYDGGGDGAAARGAENQPRQF
ncbi:MAG: hypothetical protein WKG07_05065 [Hymenobacter sp.]